MNSLNYCLACGAKNRFYPPLPCHLIKITQEGQKLRPKIRKKIDQAINQRWK